MHKNYRILPWVWTQILLWFGNSKQPASDIYHDSQIVQEVVGTKGRSKKIGNLRTESRIFKALFESMDKGILTVNKIPGEMNHANCLIDTRLGTESRAIANDMLTLANVLDYFNDVDDDEQAKAIYAREKGGVSPNVAGSGVVIAPLP